MKENKRIRNGLKLLRNDRGITLMTLVIYIISIMITLAILTIVTTYYRVNMNRMRDDALDIAEFDKFSAQFLDEVKRTNNEVKTYKNKKIEFTSGNEYEFVVEESAVYLRNDNQNIKVAERVDACKFSVNKEVEKTIITVELTIGNETRKRPYVINHGNNLASYEDESNYISQEVTGEDANWTAIYKVTAKDNYTDGSGKKATIPQGFRVSKKENTVDGGLVVRGPDGSEFVWIPVATIDEIYDRGNIAGLLYSFTATTSTPKTFTAWTTGAGREPDTIVGTGAQWDGLSTYLTAAGIGNITATQFKTMLEADFKDMITSINYYKGFYIGRYTTSLDTAGKAQSKKNKSPSKSTWYVSYKKQKDMYDSVDSVFSGMIWGCQYDSVLRFIQSKDPSKNVADSRLWGNYNDSLSPANVAGYGSEQKTGFSEYWKALNIYDLAGNVMEYTMEANSTTNRVVRGRCLPVSRTGLWGKF